MRLSFSVVFLLILDSKNISWVENIYNRQFTKFKLKWNDLEYYQGSKNIIRLICTKSAYIDYLSKLGNRRNYTRTKISSPMENSTDTNKQQIRQSTRITKNIFIYFIAMILCYSPFSIVVIISGFSSVDLKVVETFPVTVAFMNSFINPIFVLLAYDRAQNGSF